MDRLTSLRVFQTISETGSFSAAAERLGLSAAMASKHVHALEQQLGTRLLQRTTRRVSLTEAGQDYARRIVLVLAQLEEADAAAMQQSVDIRGRVRLSAPISFGMRVLGGWLAGLAVRYPQLEVELELSDRQVDLIDEGFDLALRITTTPLADGIVARPLARFDLLLCASPAYLEQAGTPQVPADLSQHACLRYSLYPQQGTDWRFRLADGSECRVPVSGPLTANNGDVLVQAACAGMGIIYQPRFLLETHLQQGTLRLLFDSLPARQAEVYAVYPARRHLPARVRVLVEHLRERLAGDCAGTVAQV